MGATVMADQTTIDDVTVDESATQQYEGDEIDSMVLAKQRMAERDAEYRTAFAKLSEPPKPKPRKTVAKRGEKPRVTAKVAQEADEAGESQAVPPFAEDAPVVKRKPEMTAPAVKAVGQSVRKVMAENAEAGDVNLADVKGGLRSLKGKSDVPADSVRADREAYSAAWKRN